MNVDDKTDEIKHDNPTNNSNNLSQENEIISITNNNDGINCHIKIKFENTMKTINEDHQLKEENKDGEDVERGSCSNNSGKSNNNGENVDSVTVADDNTEYVANQSEITTDEQYTLSDNTSNTIIQEDYAAEQEVEIGNIEELTNIIEDEENNGNGKELIFILRVQRCTDIEVASEVRQSTRSRSRGNRIRSTSRRNRRRGRRAMVQHNVPEEPLEGEAEVDDVEYETITTESIPCKRSRTWRTVPKYKRLTYSEALKQEADLYYSFVKETNPEEVEPAGPSDRQCCVCYDNKATRIVIPCGHQCLCYHCAKSIAFSRTTLASVRIPKRCPLCQAAIAAMMRPL